MNCKWELYDEFGEKVKEGVCEKMFALEEMQEMVGGRIEMLMADREHVAVVHAQGKYEYGGMCNPVMASNPFLDTVCGPVLLVERGVLEPDYQASMDDHFDRLVELMRDRVRFLEIEGKTSKAELKEYEDEVKRFEKWAGWKEKEVVKTRKPRGPMSPEKKEAMLAKRRATIAAKKA
jgi:hypothetical protein